MKGIKYTWDEDLKKLVPYGQTMKELSHTVIADEIAPTVSNADGEIYTSKRQMYRAAKSRGMEPYSESDKKRIIEQLQEGTLGPRRAEWGDTRDRFRETVRDRVERSFYEMRDGRAPRMEPVQVAEWRRKNGFGDS